MTSTPVIKCDSVYKIFGDNAEKMLQNSNGNVDAKTFQDAGCIVGVNNASFEVSKGEMLVVMGLSGSGKSTLLRCISRLTDATGGKIYIEGEDLLAMNNKQLIELRRSKMGMVFQSFALLPHKTVLENIAFPLQIKGSETDDSIKKAMEMVELVGLKGRENYFPRELSGGQQQRVGIARSLAVEPDIWFLDEPFSALDPLIRKEMQDEFLRLQGVLNKTILFITHDFDEALRLADRIAIMKDGLIEQLDTPANIVLNPKTEYVRKFTEEVPREKVLKIEAIMENSVNEKDTNNISVSKDAIIGAVDRAIGLIMNDYANGELSNDEAFHIRMKGKSQQVPALNVIGVLDMKKGPDTMKIITVMRKDDFKTDNFGGKGGPQKTYNVGA